MILRSAAIPGQRLLDQLARTLASAVLPNDTDNR